MTSKTLSLSAVSALVLTLTTQFATAGPIAARDSCYAVGSFTTNSAGFGSAGTTITTGGSISLYRSDGTEIGYSDHNACTDIQAVDSDQLSDTFNWAASCDTSSSKISECHGSYGDQGHIVGEEPKNSVNFYGLGESTSATCRIDFAC